MPRFSPRQNLWHAPRPRRRFVHPNERMINFALGDASGDADELANYTFKKKALLAPLFRGPAAEWYQNNITNATTWENVITNSITRFSD